MALQVLEVSEDIQVLGASVVSVGLVVKMALPVLGHIPVLGVLQVILVPKV
jgi:hypothetical protein